MKLQELQRARGARLAPDGIPLHFGDPLSAWRAALQQVVLLDRSHEARLRLSGGSAPDLLQRTSTNDVLQPGPGEGCPTLFTTWHGRILERIEVYREADSLLLLGGPGRRDSLLSLLQRNIFFNDDVQVADLAPDWKLFDLVGPAAPALCGRQTLPVAFQGLWPWRAEGHELLLAQRKMPGLPRLSLLVPAPAAADVWQYLCSAGAQPAGSLLFNALRVRAGLPAAGSELTTDYIPLELGLWDEVSFSKGCYTGQEIIARMESRGQLAKMMVKLRPRAELPAPAELLSGDRVVGQLTSSVTAPDGSRHALGVVRSAAATPGAQLQAQGVTLESLALAGVQPGQGSDQSGAG